MVCSKNKVVYTYICIYHMYLINVCSTLLAWLLHRGLSSDCNKIRKAQTSKCFGSCYVVSSFQSKGTYAAQTHLARATACRGRLSVLWCFWGGKQYRFSERKGFKRPGRKKPKVPKAMIIDAFVEHEQGTATAPTGLPQYVEPPVTSNLCSASRQKPRRRKQAQLNVQAPQAHQHPVYAVEPHQGQFATVANVAQMPGMCYSWCDPRFTCAQNVFYCNDETYDGLDCPRIY